ncbi:MAG: molybdopterin biosynthesis protein [Candidatus Hodarchaeota archaeon]
MKERKIFRELVTLEEAHEILSKHLTLVPDVETISLTSAQKRILAQNVISPIDVPGFDRATMDGFAVIAEDTFGAEETRPRRLKIVGRIEAGETPIVGIKSGEAIEISTGAPLPKGTTAVIMVEYTTQSQGSVNIYKSARPGENVMATGSDIMMGELILRKGCVLTPREIGVLAAVGMTEVEVFCKPRVAIISTGNEIMPLDRLLDYGQIFDVNSYSIAAAVEESGGMPILLGIGRDDEKELKEKLTQGLVQADMILTSGSTSAGIGDMVYNIIDELGKPGIIVHGIAVKPGKPTIIGIVNDKPIFGLPGYPTSALTMFNLIVRPTIQRLAGIIPKSSAKISAKVATKIHSVLGRKQFLPVNVVETKDGYRVYPSSKESGAITTLAEADGFIQIPRNKEILFPQDSAEVYLFADELRPADLVIIGSHCIGIDIILSLLYDRYPGFLAKVINVGSIGGLRALMRGEADIAGIHLFDEKTGEYNTPFIDKYGLTGEALIVRGYKRKQGLIIPKGNPKQIHGLDDLLRTDVVFINRIPGSGTRVLLDSKLSELSRNRHQTFEEISANIEGFGVEAKTHSAVAAAILYKKADAGLGIETVAKNYDLDFIPIAQESFDFVILKNRLEKPWIKRFVSMLGSETFKEELKKRPGLTMDNETSLIGSDKEI